MFFYDFDEVGALVLGIYVCHCLHVQMQMEKKMLCKKLMQYTIK